MLSLLLLALLVNVGFFCYFAYLQDKTNEHLSFIISLLKNWR